MALAAVLLNTPTITITIEGAPECVFDWSYEPLDVRESVLVFAKAPFPVALVIDTDCKTDWNS